MNQKKFKTLQEQAQGEFAKSLTNNISEKAYVLNENEADSNLYNYQDADSVENVKKYFRENKISLWRCKYDKENEITRHMLSSQIACINHLFFIKHDKKAVLAILNGIKDLPVKFKDVLNISCDKGENNYIAFEVVGSQDYLNEKICSRGANCTSVDALIYAVDENGERWLIPIEWKYTETYSRKDLSIEDKIKKGDELSGKTRLSRYCNLIDQSSQLKSLPEYKHSIYFQEPFYQLMRQTLLVECMCKNKEEKILPAEHFVHLHVCPKANVELLQKHYEEVSDKPTMEEAWRDMLSDQSLYHLIDPKDFIAPIKDTYPEFYNYLEQRYWK